MRAIAVATVLLSVASVGSAAAAMADYRWRYRPLLVFADDAAGASLVRQRGIVAANRAGLAERDVVVVWVVGTAVMSEFGPGPGQDARALRARYGVTRGAFRALLVGKDGGVKLSQAAPLDAGRLFATIDAMPMRRDEVRRK